MIAQLTGQQPVQKKDKYLTRAKSSNSWKFETSSGGCTSVSIILKQPNSWRTTAQKTWGQKFIPTNREDLFIRQADSRYSSHSALFTPVRAQPHQFNNKMPAAGSEWDKRAERIHVDPRVFLLLLILHLEILSEPLRYEDVMLTFNRQEKLFFFLSS